MHIQQFSTRAITFKLAAALEKYEADLDALVRTWLDLELLRRMQEEFSELRLLGAALPKLSVAWIAVLVSRTRLLQALGSRTASAMAALQDHLHAVAELRKRCLRSMGAQGGALA